VELSVELVDDRHGLVRLRHEGVAVALRAAGLSVPYPSGLHRLLGEVPDIQLIVVERAPAGLRDATEREGLSWLDVHGAGRVVADGLVYVASPRHDRGPVQGSRSSPFAPASSRVVKVLLSDPRRPWRLSEIAAMAQLNPGNVHRALKALLERGLLERDEDAYLLADPGSLLEAWADQHQQPRERIVTIPDGELSAFVARLVCETNGNAVVSGELAAELLAPHLPAESAIIHCMNPQTFAELSQAAGSQAPTHPDSLRQVVIDLADRGGGEFRSEHDGLPLASPIQVYVDLARDRGRGRDAAEHLRRQAIGF
jgi:hypothetical protein